MGEEEKEKEERSGRYVQYVDGRQQRMDILD